MSIEFHREGPWILPDGWVWVRLGDVSRFIGRGRGPRYVESGGVPVVNQKCVRWHHLQAQHLKQTSRDAFDALAPHLKLLQGDVLWNSTGRGTIGRALVYDGSLAETTADSHITIVRTNEINPSYVCHYLETMRVQHLVVDGNVGSTNQLELPREFVQRLEIPLPALAEQGRIVARIDQLFTEIADGETALTRAREDLDTWRRALLKAAVTGELTREWRDHNMTNDSGADILARIAAAKSTFKSSKRTRRRFVGDQAFDTELPKMPDSWAWSQLGEVGEIVGGVTVDKKRRPVDPVTVPYLRVANVQRGYLDLSEVKSITVERSVAEALTLKRGDILLNEGGDRDKIGRGWIWDGQIEGCIHQNHVFRVRLFDNNFDPYFLSHYANEMGRRFFVEEGKQTTNLASISMSKISQLPIPLVPAAELKELMRILDDALVRVLDVEADIDASPPVYAFRQSILKAAFEGRLVAQDPRDEPAEQLLARLGDAVIPTKPKGRRSRAGVAA